MLLVSIRHLPTDWNVRQLLQGQRDIPLLEPDAETLSVVCLNRRRLAELGPFEVVVTSELQRTRATAGFYGFEDFIVDPLLNELNFGDWEGRPREEFYTAYGHQWFQDPRELILGESIVEFEERVRTFVRNYSGHSRVLAFAHGSWMRALRSIVQHGDARAMNRGWIENNEILQYEV